MHQVAYPVSAVNCETLERVGGAVVTHDDTAAWPSQQAPADSQAHAVLDMFRPVHPCPAPPGGVAEDRARFDPQDSHDFSASANPLLPKGHDDTSGQLFSEGTAQQAGKAQGQNTCQSPVTAAAVQSSAHASTSQVAQHDRGLSRHEGPQGVSHSFPEGRSIIMLRPMDPVHVDTAGNLHPQPPAPVYPTPGDANQDSGIDSQRAAGSITEQPSAVTHSPGVCLDRGNSSSGCQRRAGDQSKQPEAQGGSSVDMAGNNSRQDPPGSTGDPQSMVANSNRQDPQTTAGDPENLAGNSNSQEPQGSNGGARKGSEAGDSPSAVRSCNERMSASSTVAEDAPECSPADNEPVLLENQAVLPSAKRRSQSSEKGGPSPDFIRSGLSKPQGPAAAQLRSSQCSEKPVASTDLKGRVDVGAANKENDVSSASLTASDSQASAQALMEEEQAKATAAAAAQVVVYARASKPVNIMHKCLNTKAAPSSGWMSGEEVHSDSNTCCHDMSVTVLTQNVECASNSSWLDSAARSKLPAQHMTHDCICLTKSTPFTISSTLTQLMQQSQLR